jgi:hypothetical protein
VPIPATVAIAGVATAVKGPQRTVSCLNYATRIASESSFSKVYKRFVDHEWIKIQSDLEINVPSAVTGQQ